LYHRSKGKFAQAKSVEPIADLVAILAKFGKVMASSYWIFAIGRKMQNFSNYLKVAEAADYLGISPNTLRNWVNAEKIASIRHPMNSYRLFRKEDLDALLKSVAKPQKKVRKK
jgi:DNA (cytosine-5)-methyltransferase 1